jgi:uncharacterized protein (DUF433 family)
MDWSKCPAVDRDPERMGGVWCFRGIRLAVVSLFEYLDKGSTVEEFLECFPAVTAEDVHEVLAFVMASLEQEQPAAVA